MYLYPEFHFGSNVKNCDTIVFSHKNYGHFIRGQTLYIVCGSLCKLVKVLYSVMVLVILLLIIYGLIYIGLFLTFSMAAGLFFIALLVSFLLAFSCFICAEILYFYTQKMG